MTNGTSEDREESRQRDMSNRMSRRFKGQSEETVSTDETSSTTSTTEPEESSSTTQPEETTSTEETTVRETKGRTFFVGEDALNKIDAKYKELDAKWYAEHGEDLPKNKMFYPALFEAIDWEKVEEELGISEDD